MTTEAELIERAEVLLKSLEKCLNLDDPEQREAGRELIGWLLDARAGRHAGDRRLYCELEARSGGTVSIERNGQLVRVLTSDQDLLLLAEDARRLALAVGAAAYDATWRWGR